LTAAGKQQNKRSTGDKIWNPEKRRSVEIKSHESAQILFWTTSRFSKDMDAFTQMVSNRNTSSGRRVFASCRKRGGGCEIAWKDGNIVNIRKRRTTF